MDDELALSQTDTLKHGTRYTDAEKETAYLFWRTVCGRSARKTAERVGTDDATIHRWRIAGGWIERADQEDTEDYASSRHGVAAIVVTELVKSLEVVTAIRDNETASNKDRLNAAFWLAGLAGVSPVSKIEQAVTEHRSAQTVDILPDFATMSHDELRDYEERVKKQRQRKTLVATERIRT